MSLDVFRLDDRVAIVTGGSKGLGRAMARALAEAGADLVVTSRHLDEAEDAAAEIRGVGRRAIALESDVSDPAAAKALAERARAEFGRIDILVNNAGINPRGPALELSEAEWHECLETNLTGPWLCSRAVAPYMMARRWGRIINMASMLASVTIPGRTPYASSKGGLLMLTKTLALEWAPYGITVNAICPGPFETEINRQLLQDPAAYQAFLAKIPLGRWGQPEELGPLAVYLASEASAFMTGAALAIDGGWTCQ
ncbi:MAG: SDR family oxidoreductase [Armatimonadetes bacterium]|nr:SDR family oxidoreductase [Armatimonadota bacterium]